MNIYRTFVLVLALTVAGCHNAETGPEVHDTNSVPKDAATALRAEIHMKAGTLTMKGEAQGWLDAGFTYNVPSWKPTVTYNAVGATGELRVDQPESGTSGSNTKNEWDLRLNNEIATDLTAQLGAGDANLNLGSILLRSLSIEVGAGTLNLDLRGHARRSYDVRIRGGAGDATVHLPSGVGIYAEASGGIGDISVTGLRKDGDHWVNDAYGTAPIQVKVDAKGGVGGITLIAE